MTGKQGWSAVPAARWVNDVLLAAAASKKVGPEEATFGFVALCMQSTPEKVAGLAGAALSALSSVAKQQGRTVEELLEETNGLIAAQEREEGR